MITLAWEVADEVICGGVQRMEEFYQDITTNLEIYVKSGGLVLISLKLICKEIN